MSRTYQLSLITLSLEILGGIAYGAPTGEKRRVLRLALRVLMPCMENRAPLEEYWKRATTSDPRPWLGCHDPLSAIKAELRRCGWHPDDGDYPPEAPDLCAQLSLPTNSDRVIERYAVADLMHLTRAPMSGVIGPGGRCWAITLAHGGARSLMVLEWGLRLGVLSKVPRSARRVTVIGDAASPFWSKGSVVAGAYPAERCLIPVSELGYREPSVSAGPATTWFVVSDEEMFSVAGLFFSHPYHAVAMHVSEANPMLAPFGKTMPLILHREDEQAWLERGDLARLASPYPSQLMRKLVEQGRLPSPPLTSSRNV